MYLSWYLSIIGIQDSMVGSTQSSTGVLIGSAYGLQSSQHSSDIRSMITSTGLLPLSASAHPLARCRGRRRPLQSIERHCRRLAGVAVGQASPRGVALSFRVLPARTVSRYWFLDPRVALGRSLAYRVFQLAPRRVNFSWLGRPLVELRSPSGSFSAGRHRRPEGSAIGSPGVHSPSAQSRCVGPRCTGLPRPLCSGSRVVPRDSLLPACSPRILAALFTPPRSWGSAFRAFSLTRSRGSFPSPSSLAAVGGHAVSAMVRIYRRSHSDDRT
jgi:hypothetical protein